MQRRTVLESWSYLEELGYEVPRHDDGRPLLPPRMPGHDDDLVSFQLFRAALEDDDLSHLSMPRTFFSRSEVRGVRFCNSDLSESWMCWNDFIDCDFEGADLRECDMRASVFQNCTFSRADLTGADMRQSSFDGCTFEEATFHAVVLTRTQGKSLPLSPVQLKQITFMDVDGDEPAGG